MAIATNFPLHDGATIDSMTRMAVSGAFKPEFTEAETRLIQDDRFWSRRMTSWLGIDPPATSNVYIQFATMLYERRYIATMFAREQADPQAIFSMGDPDQLRVSLLDAVTKGHSVSAHILFEAGAPHTTVDDHGRPLEELGVESMRVFLEEYGGSSLDSDWESRIKQLTGHDPIFTDEHHAQFLAIWAVRQRDIAVAVNELRSADNTLLTRLRFHDDGALGEYVSWAVAKGFEFSLDCIRDRFALDQGLLDTAVSAEETNVLCRLATLQGGEAVWPRLAQAGI
jgi:hypothetical protein